MNFKYYFFDWDGTLADTLPIWFEGFLKIFKEYGIETSYKEIGEKVLGDWDGPANLGITDTDEFFEKMEKELITSLNEVQLNEGVMEMVKRIKSEGGKIGVLTNSKKRWVKGALRNTGLREYIDVFLGREDVDQTKPDPEIIFKALGILRGDKSEVVMTGDSIKDIEAAKRAGINSVLYLPERYSEFYDFEKQRRLGADREIKSFDEI